MEDAALVSTAAVAVVATLVAAGLFARALAGLFPRLVAAPAGDRNAALDGLRGFLAVSVVLPPLFHLDGPDAVRDRLDRRRFTPSTTWASARWCCSS